MTSGPSSWIARAYVALTLLAGVARLRRRVLRGLDRRALPARSPHALLRPPAGTLARLLRPPPPRRPDLAPDRGHRLDRGVRALRSDATPSPIHSASSSSAGALFYLQWDLASSSLLVAPLFWLAARHFSRLIKHASREKRRRSGSISAVAEESLANAALVQAYNRQETEVERFHRENLGSFHAEMASTRLQALSRR